MLGSVREGAACAYVHTFSQCVFQSCRTQLNKIKPIHFCCVASVSKSTTEMRLIELHGTYYKKKYCDCTVVYGDYLWACNVVNILPWYQLLLYCNCKSSNAGSRFPSPFQFVVLFYIDSRLRTWPQRFTLALKGAFEVTGPWCIRSRSCWSVIIVLTCLQKLFRCSHW